MKEQMNKLWKSPEGLMAVESTRMRERLTTGITYN